MNFKSIFNSIFKEFSSDKKSEKTVVEADKLADSHFDVFSNEVHLGEFVIPVKYNDVKRRGYYTVSKMVKPMKVDYIKGNYIKYDYYKEIRKDHSRVVESNSRGFLHILR